MTIEYAEKQLKDYRPEEQVQPHVVVLKEDHDMPDEYVRVANGVMHLTNLGPYGREAINRMRRDGWLRAGRTSREYVCTDGPTPAVSAESTSGSPRRIGF